MDDAYATSGQARNAVAPGAGFIEWSAVLAGGAMAAALSFALLTFGSAIGLSIISPTTDSGASARVVGGLAVFWAMAQQIGSAMAGGYIAGRMRTRWADANSDEVDFRDGLHGGLVWAVGVLITAGILVSSAGSAIRTGADAVGRVASSVNVDPLAYQIDTLLRSAPRPAGPGPSPAATAPPTAGPSPAIPAADSDVRAELLRTFASTVATGRLTDSDRSYIARVVAQRTGLSQQDAEVRVNEVTSEAIKVAKETAERARRSAIVVALVTAASLVISLAAAWWAGIQGGNHRDNSVPARFNLPPLAHRPVA